MITYREQDSAEIKVWLDGKYVGTIFSLPDGSWQYWPKGPRSEGGEKFPTLAACKRSLGPEA